MTVLIEGVVFLSLGIYSIIEGIRLMGVKGVGQIDVFGPGRYSIILGFVLTVLGLAHVVLNCKEEKFQGKPEMRKKLINIIVCLILFLFLIKMVGFLLASMVFFLLIFWIVGFRSWPIIVGMSLGISFSFYLLFVSLLNMMFPSGLLFKYF